MRKFIWAIKYVLKTDEEPRSWSNHEVKKFAHLFTGDIVNVSGWDDRDKEGRKYADYFINKKSYTITNYRGEKGISNLPNEIFLDLEDSLPKDLEGRFDVVFNHTTLEHVFHVFAALRNLCLLSRDIVIIVIPFIEAVHEIPGSFNDYWRPTHLAIERLFEENGFTVLHGSSNKVLPLYYFFIASRHPEKWKTIFGEYDHKNINQGSQTEIFKHSLVEYITFPFKRPKSFLGRIRKSKKVWSLKT